MLLRMGRLLLPFTISTRNAILARSRVMLADYALGPACRAVVGCRRRLINESFGTLADDSNRLERVLRALLVAVPFYVELQARK